jgi:hypothetical protein
MKVKFINIDDPNGKGKFKIREIYKYEIVNL